MRLSIGENIKRLRRERDITQEQLAEIFNVSCQTISRWETDSSYPDIEMLPVIANFFNITVDKLMGMDENLEAKKVEKYLLDFQMAISKGLVYECVRIARDGVKEFPNNYELLNKLMYALFIACSDDADIPEWKENMQKYDSEIVSLGERIIKYCPNQNIRLEATSRLAFQHCEMGRKDVGRKLYETLPSEAYARENQIWWALNENEKLPFIRESLNRNARYLSYEIWHLASGKYLSDEDSIKVFEKLIELDKLIYDGTHTIENWLDEGALVDMAEIYARLGNKEKAIETLKIIVKWAIEFDNRPEKGYSDSLLLGHREWHKKDFETADSRPTRIKMRDVWLSAKGFDSIRETKEFKEIIESLS